MNRRGDGGRCAHVFVHPPPLLPSPTEAAKDEMQKRWPAGFRLAAPQGESTIFEAEEREKKIRICSYAARQRSACPSLADIPSVAFMIYFFK